MRIWDASDRYTCLDTILIEIEAARGGYNVTDDLLVSSAARCAGWIDFHSDTLEEIFEFPEIRVSALNLQSTSVP